MIDYCYRIIQAYICQVVLDTTIMGNNIPTPYDLTPINLYYAVANIGNQTDEQDWW